MTIPAGSELLARCERLVEMALARKADEAEAYWEADEDLSIEIENGKVASTGGGRSQGGSLRVVSGGRPGFAYLTDWKDAGSAIDRALLNATAMPAKGYHLPAATRLRSPAALWDDEVALLDHGRAAGWARDLVTGAKESCPAGTVTGGGVSQSAGVWALCSSLGAAVEERSTLASAGCSLVLSAGGTSVSASESKEGRTARLDAHAVGVQAGATTKSLAGPKAIQGGAMDVILEPEVALEMLAAPAAAAATGDDALRGKTCWSGQLGNVVASSAWRLHDDASAPGSIPGPASDGEGLATRPLSLVEGGVLGTYLFDSWDGHQHGRPSTHSAQRPGFKGRPETGTHNLVMGGAAPKSVEGIVAGVDRGLLIDSVLGAHTANPTTGEFSVTAPNVWLIEKGAVVGPVTEVALAGSLGGWAKAVEAVSVPARQGEGWVMPRVLIRGASVSV
ncbi:MAG: TldD/PmbA family protein [Thermoplasmatota archaeon]